MSISDKQGLIQFIEKSFADTGYPGQNRLFKDVSDPDIPAFGKILRSRYWKDTLRILEKQLVGSRVNFYDAITAFLTLEALHYFLPAFLIISLDERSDVFGYQLFLHVNPVLRSYGEDDDRCFSGLSELLSRPQKRAVAMAYQFRQGTDAAMQHYWAGWLDS